MNNNQYNEKRYNKLLRWYRFTFGLQQMVIHPLVNISWLLFLGEAGFLLWGEKRILSEIKIPSFMQSVLHWCMISIVVLFLVFSIVGLIQLIGHMFARKDEADMCLIFGSRRDIKNQLPILIHKKTDRSSGVTKREFYSSIPMERWKENKEAICDRLDIHIIKDFDYGGKRHNKGNHICFYSAKGRLPEDRGIMYDDEF